MIRLVYIADPMCSWCYGFGPQLSALLAQIAPFAMRLVMGGLRAYNTKVMDEALKTTLREHWQHVREASGLPFADNQFARSDFVYDTEPACRAVVTVREQNPERALEYFYATQAAFYRDGRDVTQGEVLADIAAELGLARAPFALAWQSEAMKETTREDFLLSQRFGVSGFPTLAMEHGGQLYLVANGFTRAEVLAERVAQIAASSATAEATDIQGQSESRERNV
jgi:putative protein-disulfide isomerase